MPNLELSLTLVLYKVEAIEVVSSSKGITNLRSETIVTNLEKGRVLYSYSTNKDLKLSIYL